MQPLHFSQALCDVFRFAGPIHEDTLKQAQCQSTTRFLLKPGFGAMSFVNVHKAKAQPSFETPDWPA